MGGSYSCCVKSAKNVTNTSRNTEVNSHTVVITEQPTVNSKPPVDIAFPRYSVLPSIEATTEPVATPTKGNALAMGDSSSVMNLYNKYVNQEMGQISAEGIEQLCTDLDLSPEDFRVLVLAYSLGAQVMCRFTEDEFVKGCVRLGISSVHTMKQSIPGLLNLVQGSAFTPFYQWTYKFALDVESGQRTLPTDMAISLWKLVFYQNYPPILDRWLNYIQENTSVKGISKDTWDMFLIFVNQIGDDLRSYDDTEAWPSLLDDFVEYELTKA